MSEDIKICKVCKYTEDEYSVEITEGEVCDNCRNMNEMFQTYRQLIAEGVIDPDAKHEWHDFTDEQMKEYPLLEERGIHGEWHLTSQIDRQLERALQGRMRQYKIATGKPLYSRSTPIFKRDDKKRKAPLVSATCFKIGDMMTGCTRMGIRGSYIVKQRKDGTQFWAKASNNDTAWKRWVAKNYLDMEITFVDKIRDRTAEESLEEFDERTGGLFE